MDNPSASWSPKPALLVIGWLLAAVTATAAVFTGLAGDRGGMVLFGVGALLFAALSAYGTVLRPKLTANAEGIAVRTLSGTQRLAWTQTRVRLVRTRRLGRETPTLEIEHGDLLLVLGWIELGADPHDVLDVLGAFRA
ncbi:hypothetical protein CFN78_13285 [Amycolatopsis antarctica]|uniref:Low molecular weight protein antigen 6 PH domain-containing protein n=1 Tax=Amycolatopsis antarctica TaxID=1854586 RepID=A0A263D2N0_9PSEU|nr:PH domain-containing protein [Amycolatopsis antarctica]OZM72611.1 hypothetical protein CFN78_13285 [Amycolatopsis antarctica]